MNEPSALLRLEAAQVEFYAVFPQGKTADDKDLALGFVTICQRNGATLLPGFPQEVNLIPDGGDEDDAFHGIVNVADFGGGEMLYLFMSSTLGVILLDRVEVGDPNRFGWLKRALERAQTSREAAGQPRLV